MTDPATTDDVRTRAAAALRASSGASAGSPRVLVGFDGFLDSITSAVGTRRSMIAGDYVPMRTIDALAGRIAGAGGGRSVNIELRERELRAGGNGPLLASALCAQGAEVTLIGALGGSAAQPVHPAYEPLIDRCERAVSVGPSARTDALEFDDGKVMFNWSANLDPIDWRFLVDRVGLDELTAMCAQADAVATINWTNMGGLPSIWEGLRDEVFPAIERAPAVFVDLSDPAKRTDEDVRTIFGDLAAINALAPVTLGLNLAESARLSALLLGESLPASRDPEAMECAAVGLRDAMGLSAVLVHTRGVAAGATDQEAAVVRTRVTERPAISTGAGDHFNGGYLAARLRGLGLAESLAAGCDTASCYVTQGVAPDLAGLCAFMESADGMP